MVEVFYPGLRLWILLMDGAQETYEEACSQVPGNRRSCIAQLLRYIERLGDFGTLHSEDQFRHEDNGIHAIKARRGLRAYGWFDSYRGHKVFVISHFVLKKRAKLDPADLKRAEAQRTVYQEVT